MLDAIWIEMFKRPPDERDDCDEPRLWRALEAKRLWDASKPFREMDREAQDAMEMEDPDLWDELSRAFGRVKKPL